MKRGGLIDKLTPDERVSGFEAAAAILTAVGAIIGIGVALLNRHKELPIEIAPISKPKPKKKTK